jgi:ABC-type Fe3+ transport system substrate-binding protein
MKSGKVSRRDLLRMLGMTSGVTLLAACMPPAVAPSAPAGEAPTSAPAKEEAKVTQYDLSKPENVKLALMEEGQEVSISSWGFSGLPQTHFIPKFAELTQKLYGVPVKLNWIGGVFDTALRELPVAGKTIADIGLDVVDKEEESFDAAMAVNWYEPIERDPYKPLVPNLAKLEDPYIFKGPAENGGDTYGAVYQGYEWLQSLLRKDKVQVADYSDWWDLSRTELKDKIITYPMNDQRGHFIFAGFVNQLVKEGRAEKLWDQPAWEIGLQEWKDRGMEGQIHKWGDLGNDPTMRMMIQTGEAWAGGLWGTYTRGLLAADWNQRDDVIYSFVPKAGCVADRETCSAVRGCKHPVAARILINWMMSTEFNTAGWYKAEGEAEATNHWDITEALFLTAYSGGVYPEMRQAIPAWATPYYAKDPGNFLIKADWQWYNQNSEWISKSYEKIVLGQ